jgi:staphyloferrin A synthase
MGFAYSGPVTRGARAAVMTRLWQALTREPITPRELRGGPEVVLLDGQRYDDPGALVRALDLGAAGERLARELDDSVANLTLARAAQPVPDGGPPVLVRYDLAGLEQCVVDGHPVHPLCRTRLGMSPAEVRAYAPEHRPVVGLRVYAVPPRDWFSTGTGLPPRLLVHPWQAEHVLPAYPSLVPTGETVPARPLMSLRTLAVEPGWHVKTSIDVQMTSAVRIVSPAAVRNGPVVSALLAGLGRRAGLGVMREVAAGAVLVDGEPCRSLAMVRRQAPVPPPGTALLPLAVLAAPSPATGAPILTEAVTLGYRGRPLSFVRDLLRVLLPPPLRLLDRGVALEAHGQNTLVLLRNGQPRRLWYRDVGGIRVSPKRLGTDPPLYGDLKSDDPQVLRTKLFAALYVVLDELAATLATAYGIEPDTFWRLVAGVVRDCGAQSGSVEVDGLFGATLPIKATTAMRLAANPIEDLWTTVPNPMAGLR